MGRDCGKGFYSLEAGESFFEFIPLGARDKSKEAVTADEVKAGTSYEILVTNRSGLYRYAVGDVVKIEEIREMTPVYSLRGRCHDILTVSPYPDTVIRIEPDDMTDLIRQSSIKRCGRTAPCVHAPAGDTVCIQGQADVSAENITGSDKTGASVKG